MIYREKEESGVKFAYAYANLLKGTNLALILKGTSKCNGMQKLSGILSTHL